MQGFLVRQAVVALALWAGAPGAQADAFETGKAVPDLSLRQIGGAPTPVVDRAAQVTAMVFFRSPHERSWDTLRMLASCQPKLAGKPVRFVGIVPADSAASAKADVDAAGAKLQVLVDEGDQVYSALGMRLHPGIAIVDRSRRVVAFEPYHNVDYCDIVVARIRRTLGEIGDAEVARVVAPPPSALPGGDDKGGVAHRHVAFGRKLLDTRAYAQAHENARKALAVAPTAEAWRLEGDIFTAEGNCPAAVKAFDSALKLDPKDPGAAAGRKSCGR
jgi:hypothetical protein